MKIKIREGIFESNSSSTHSLSVSRKSSYDYESIKRFIALDGALHIVPEEFGWEEREYRLPYNKIQYAFEMIYMTEFSYDELKTLSVDEIYESEGFQALKEAILENISECKDVVVEPIEDTWSNPFGYIDYQSCENYKSLQHFLSDYDVTLEEFIFNTGIILKTDNDNH